MPLTRRGRARITISATLLPLAVMLAGGTCLAADAALSVADIVEARDLSDVTVSPDGRLVAFRVLTPDLATNRMYSQWHTVDVDSGSDHLAGDGGPPITVWNGIADEPPQWSADSQWIYFRVLKDDEIQIWRGKWDGSGSHQVTSDSANVDRFSLDPLRGVVFYVVRASRSEIDEADQSEAKSGILYDTNILSSAELNSPIRVGGRLGSVRLFNGHHTTVLGDAPERIRVVDPGTGRTWDAEPSERERYAELQRPLRMKAFPRAEFVRSSPNGKAVAFLLPVEPATPNMYGEQVSLHYRLYWARSPDAATATPCPAEECVGTARMLRDFSWDPSSQGIIFSHWPQIADPIATLYRWDMVAQRINTLLRSSGQLSGRDRSEMAGCPVSARAAVCIMSAAAGPPSLVSIDLKSARMRVLFDPNSVLRRKQHAKTEHMNWTDSDGVEWSGWLVWPSDYRRGTRYPLIITSYTCTGYLRGGFADTTPEFVLAQKGFFALCAHTNSDAIDEVWQYGQSKIQSARERAAYINKRTVASWHAAIEDLDQRGLIDRHHVGVSGLSFSAQAAAYGISHTDDFAAAATAVSDYLDPFWPYFDLRPEGNAGLQRVAGLPWPQDDPDGLYAIVSPALNARKVWAPLLIQAPDNEFRVNLMFYQSLVHYGKPVEMIIFPGEGHVFHQPTHKVAVGTRNIEWFRFWLQGQEDPDPTKAAQYARWRKLRELLATKGSAP